MKISKPTQELIEKALRKKRAVFIAIGSMEGTLNQSKGNVCKSKHVMRC